MQIVIGDVLKDDDLMAVRDALEQVRFVDGKDTAGFAARRVKDNRQADALDRSLDPIRAMVAKRILANDLFRIAARPKQLSAPGVLAVVVPDPGQAGAAEGVGQVGRQGAGHDPELTQSPGAAHAVRQQ